METRMFIWLGGTAIGLTPLGMFPDKIIAFLIGAHLANKSFGDDAKEDKGDNNKEGGKAKRKPGNSADDGSPNEDDDESPPEDSADEDPNGSADDFDSWEEELGNNDSEEPDRELESAT